MFLGNLRLLAGAACIALVLPMSAAATDLSTANYERGRKVSQLCVACHGPKGGYTDAETPRIAGQQASYMVQQLLRMRAGTWVDKNIELVDPSDPRAMTGVRRENKHMEDVLIRLSDVDIIDVSVYFSVQPCIAGTTSQKAAPRIVARCQSCHGGKGLSTNPHVPNLAGQSEAYLMGQLLAFRDAHHGVSWGGKSERGAKIMQGQAKLLSDQDISGLAAYYASLPCAP